MLKPVKTPEGWTINDQLNKLKEELSEVEKEVLKLAKRKKQSNYLKYELCLEIVDLQTACETMLNMLKVGDDFIHEVKQDVIAKNNKRLYYE